MTISNPNNEVIYVGPGQVFNYPYPVFSIDDLKVTIQFGPQNTIINPVINGGGTYDFTVSGTFDPATLRYPNGVTVTLNTSLPDSTYQVALQNRPVLIQTTDYQDGGPLPAELIERDFDRAYVALQSVQSGLSFTGGSGGGGGVTDHGALTGLGDDDHAQYLLANGARQVSGGFAVGSPTGGIPATGFINAKGFLVDGSPLGGGGSYTPTAPTVKDYGAVGDGTTDDTTAFQTAMNAGLVIVPPGTYRLTAKLAKANGDVAFLGYNQNSCLLLFDCDDGGIEVGVGGTTGQQRAISVQNLGILTNRASNAGTALRAYFRPVAGGSGWDKAMYVSNVLIRGQTIGSHNWERGIHASQPIGCFIQYTRIVGRIEWTTWNFMTEGILFDEAGDSGSIQNVIDRTQIYFANRGISFINGSNPNFEGTHVSMSDVVFCNTCYYIDGTAGFGPQYVFDRVHADAANHGMEIVGGASEVWLNDALFYHSYSPSSEQPKLQTPGGPLVKWAGVLKSRITNGTFESYRMGEGEWLIDLLSGCNTIDIRGNRLRPDDQGGVLVRSGAVNVLGQMNRLDGSGSFYLNQGGSSNEWYAEYGGALSSGSSEVDVLAGATPTLRFEETDTTDQDFQLILNSGIFRIQCINDAGTFVASGFRLGHVGGAAIGNPSGGVPASEGVLNVQGLLVNGTPISGAPGETLTLEGAAPKLVLKENDTTNQDFQLLANSGQVRLQCVDDAGTFVASGFRMTHAGGAALGNPTGGVPASEGVLNVQGIQVNGSPVSGGVSDHGGLSGLGDDDHTQYVLANGTRAMSSLTVSGSSPTIFMSETDTSNQNFQMVGNSGIWRLQGVNNAGSFVYSGIRWTHGQGFAFGNPTGGIPAGEGIINAQGVLDDNVALTCYVIEYANTGEIDLAYWDSVVADRKDEEGEVIERRRHEPARAFAQRTWTVEPEKYSEFWRKQGHLPAFPSRQQWKELGGNLPLGDMVQRLWETVEVQAVHIETLRQEIEALKRKVGE